MKKNIVIIGAGQASFSLASKLRDIGFDGPVTILGNESFLPYQRPPLSKKYLLEETTQDFLSIRPLSWYQQRQIEVIFDCPVDSIDVDSKKVRCCDNRLFSFTQLALTVGARPRVLDRELGGSLEGVFSLRSIDDVDRMRDFFVKKKRLVVIGGGYIGLEVAAIASLMGLSVTVVEAAERILGRVASTLTADYFRKLHLSHDVDFYEGSGGIKIVGEEKVEGVVLQDGCEIAADFVVVGIGIIPNMDLAQQANLACEHGILVDVFSCSSHKDIFAAGDCTSFPYQGGRIRLENVQNAIDQAENVALNMLGHSVAYQPKPWFWSDQYNKKLQIAGLNLGYDDAILRAGERPGSQSVWYYRKDCLIAVDVINHPALYVLGKKLIFSGKSIPKTVVQDLNVSIKDWI